MSATPYRRLTGSQLRYQDFATILAYRRASLWAGMDHLLSVDSTRYTEEYKRFYFRDIQAITIRTTRRRLFWNLILGALLLLWLVLVLNIPAGPAAFAGGVYATLLYLWFPFLAIPLAANILLGPTCTAYLKTAVQTEELPSLNRVRRARKVLARIRPLISSAQGGMAPEEVAVRMKEIDAAAPAVTGPLNL